MRKHAIVVMLLGSGLCRAVIVDRAAVVIGSTVIKDSDIAQDLRMTDFLNGEPASITPAARKRAVNRLIDQALIRAEIAAGDYPAASIAEAQRLLADVRARYTSDTAY